MDMDWFTWSWLIGGVLLMVAELAIPGGVVFFLGLAGVLVGGARILGFLEAWMPTFTTWFVLSLVLLVSMRGLVSRIAEGETSTQSTDEDLDAYGQVVEVIEAVCDDNHKGRIHFRGSSWSATCLDGTLPAGSQARIAYRDNMVWVVESMAKKEELNEREKPLLKD